MDIKEQALFLENRHPWETARFLFFNRLLSSHIPWFRSNSTRSALDVGSGDGWFAEKLMQATPAFSSMLCWDTAYSTAQLEAAAPLRVSKIRSRPEGRFDLLLLMDVLEHIEKDHDFLHGLVSDNLKETGYVLISVPAWNCLYSEHDRFLGHFRRYSFRSTKSLIESSGLKILHAGGVFHALLLPRVFCVLREHARKTHNPSGMVGVAQWKHGVRTTNLVNFLLSCDNAMSLLFAKTGWRVPGLSGWVLCQKRP